MRILDKVFDAVLPGQGGSRPSTCTAVVPAVSHALTAPGGAGNQPPPRQDTGTGCGDPSPYMPAKERGEIGPILDTKGPLNWDEFHNGFCNAYDGYGRRIYYMKEMGSKVELHFYPEGTVKDKTHIYMGTFQHPADAKRIASANHRGRSGGKGY